MNGRKATLNMRPREKTLERPLHPDRRPTLKLRPVALREAEPRRQDAPMILGEWLVYRGLLTRE